MSTSRRVAQRYIAARRVAPFLIERSRIEKWIETLTGKKLKHSMLAGQGGMFKLSAIFEDGSQVNYEITFSTDLTQAGVELRPLIRAISPINGR